MFHVKHLGGLTDTIAAIATPIGEGGVGIIRLSGEQAIPIAGRMFRLKASRSLQKLPSHTIHFGRVVDGEKMLDEGLIAIMKAPHSYTREDVVEIQAHGGQIPLKKILKLAISKGARLAGPGEFTRRAFLNGRLDLTQAEAVLDLIRAQTEPAYEMALGQLKGELSGAITGIRERIINLLTEAEASIDFPEESGLKIRKSYLKKITGIRRETNELERQAEKGRILKEGLRAVIIGRPNVGKSSLLNALLKEKRVIVTHIPGTTRDVVEERVDIGGIGLKIADTAGLRKARNLIELQGVSQSRRYLKKADIAILVFDGSKPLKKEDLEIIKSVKEAGKKPVLVINKIDLPRRLEKEKLEAFFPLGKAVEVSAKKGTGLSCFRRRLASKLGLNGKKQRPGIIISSLRHQLSLQASRQALKEAEKAFKKGFSMEFVAYDLWRAADSLGEILGLTFKEDLLDQIFSQFCIGK